MANPLDQSPWLRAQQNAARNFANTMSWKTWVQKIAFWTKDIKESWDLILSQKGEALFKPLPVPQPTIPARFMELIRNTFGTAVTAVSDWLLQAVDRFMTKLSMNADKAVSQGDISQVEANQAVAGVAEVVMKSLPTMKRESIVSMKSLEDEGIAKESFDCDYPADTDQAVGPVDLGDASTFEDSKAFEDFNPWARHVATNVDVLFQKMFEHRAKQVAKALALQELLTNLNRTVTIKFNDFEQTEFGKIEPIDSFTMSFVNNRPSPFSALRKSAAPEEEPRSQVTRFSK